MSGVDQGAASASGSVKETGLVIGALGVVYGDIGTSPLYTLRECLTHGIGFDLKPATILGVLSIIFWSLVLVVTVKYIVFIMRADNEGEGGILALTALALRSTRGRPRKIMMILGLAGAALFFGDCLITPAISVLSAVEGLEVIQPRLQPWVIPISLLVLVALFMFQKGGTARVGAIFGPLMVLWFGVLGALGIYHIALEPSVLGALSPIHGFHLLTSHGGQVFILLGGVVLAVTGGEALYADMGHFGKRPIRAAWYKLVLPALTLNYFGQGALLLREPSAIENPFFHMAPGWGLVPLVCLATLATVIASQAVISGAFSITRQACLMRYLPRMRILHTSAEEMGQIYLPTVNWALLAGVVALIAIFQTSSALANAYGIAVTGTMVITTLLAYKVARRLGRWSRKKAVMLFVVFLTIDLGFFASTLLKFADGGWFPVVVGIVMFIVMAVWRRGRSVLQKMLADESVPLESILDSARRRNIPRVSGTAVFLTANRDAIPNALLHNLKHNQVLHERVVFLTVEVGDKPHHPATERVEVTPLQGGFFRAIVHLGFKDETHIHHILKNTKIPGLVFDDMTTSYFVSRETIVVGSKNILERWRDTIFVLLSKLASGVTEYYEIPPGRVVELGRQLQV